MKKVIIWIILALCLLTSCSNVNITSSDSSNVGTSEPIGQGTMTDTVTEEVIDVEEMYKEMYGGIFDTTAMKESYVKLYPIPKGVLNARKGKQHTVCINRQEASVFRTEVTVDYEPSGYISGAAEYVSFDFDGVAVIEVLADYDIDHAVILPSRDDITCYVRGRYVFFEITKPGQYFVKLNGAEYNGATVEHPLYIFANAPETDVPSAEDKNVVYFEAGYHRLGTYTLKSDTVYYLEAGAYLCGQFVADHVSNVTICGRGILSGEFITADMNAGRAMYIKNGQNICVDGITVIHPWYWTMEFENCDTVRVNNVKTISHGMSSDAIDIFGTSHVVIENCFFRAYDDCIVIKAQVNECQDIVARNCVIWCDSSNPMEIGYETHYDTYDVLFENIDVINQAKAPSCREEAIIGIELHNAGDVYDITYRDIRIDLKLDDTYSLFRFAVDEGSGSIRNIRVEDVYANYGGFLGGRIYGKAGVSPITDIHFHNIVNSKEETLTPSTVRTNDHVGEVVIANSLPDNPCQEGGIRDVYDIKADYSEDQGDRCFYYYYKQAGTTKLKEMYFNGTCWKAPGLDLPLIQWLGMHSTSSHDAVIGWKAPKTGKIVITGSVCHPNQGGDGIIASIFHQYFSSPLFQHRFAGSDTKAVDMGRIEVDVKEGQMIYFSENSIQTSDCDSAVWSFRIAYVEG